MCLIIIEEVISPNPQLIKRKCNVVKLLVFICVKNFFCSSIVEFSTV